MQVVEAADSAFFGALELSTNDAASLRMAFSFVYQKIGMARLMETKGDTEAWTPSSKYQNSHFFSMAIPNIGHLSPKRFLALEAVS